MTPYSEEFINVEGNTCMICGQRHSVLVKEKDLDEFESGAKNVQHCFPYLKAEEREILISGMNEECWIKGLGEVKQ